MRTNLKKSGFVAAVAGVVVSGLLATTSSPSGATTQVSSVEQRVSTTAAADEYDPAVSGDWAVYTSNSNGDTDVYAANLVTPEERLITSDPADPGQSLPGNQDLADISGTLITYTDLETVDVMVHDLATGVTTNLTGPANAMSLNSAISGTLVAWEDRRDGDAEVYAQDLSTGEERRITNAPTIDQRPAVANGRIVWEKCVGAACDIYAYDWATGATRQVTATPEAERRPDISGNQVVYESRRAGEQDIYRFDLSAGVETRLVRPGDQTNTNISGDAVLVEDFDESGFSHLAVWDLVTGSAFTLTGDPGAQYLNDISGNRVVYTDDRNGQLDIYARALTVARGRISVPATTYSFGDVKQDSAASTLVTVSNTGAAPLVITGVALSGLGFSSTPATPLPATVAAGGTLDIPVTFTAGALGAVTGVLTVSSDDPAAPTTAVALSATSVTKDVTVGQQMAAVLAFFDQSVQNRSLVGTGNTRTAGLRVRALRSTLEVAYDLIGRNRKVLACATLVLAQTATDGRALPPDWVTGAAAPQLAAKIAQVRVSLGC